MRTTPDATGAAVTLVVTALGLASCAPPVASDFRGPTNFRESNCRSEPPTISGPQIGSQINSRLMEGENSSMTIQSTVTGLDKGRIAYNSVFTLPDGVTFQRPRSTYAGVLYAGDASGGIERTFVYSTPPLPVLHALRPGETASFSVTENILDGSRELSSRHEFSVELLACGTLTWSGADEPVRVYRARLQNATITRDGRVDGRGQETVTAYVSSRLGWPLRREYLGGTSEEVVSLRLGPG